MMSGSETGLIASREAYGVTLQPVLQNMHLSPISSDYPHFEHSTNPSVGPIVAPPPGYSAFNSNMSIEPLKKKRGRPRKYSPDGTAVAPLTLMQGGAFLSSPNAVSVPTPTPSSSSSFKKARGRPLGSGGKKKQKMEGLGSCGLGFTPHVVTVKAGEDVSSKIMSFSQQGQRSVCILSANGAISNVTLRQQAASGGSVTYEGRFEILVLSGSFLLSENNGQRSRTGGLSVSLAGPDGRILGGGVAGLLTAATPVQVVLGSFMAGGTKEVKLSNQADLLTATPNFPLPSGVSMRPGSPLSNGTHSESSDGGGSPLNHVSETYNNNNPHVGMSNIPWK